MKATAEWAKSNTVPHVADLLGKQLKQLQSHLLRKGAKRHHHIPVVLPHSSWILTCLFATRHPSRKPDSCLWPNSPSLEEIRFNRSIPFNLTWFRRHFLKIIIIFLIYSGNTAVFTTVITLWHAPMHPIYTTVSCQKELLAAYAGSLQASSFNYTVLLLFEGQPVLRGKT